MKRLLPLLAVLPLLVLAACATPTGTVTLLPAEPGANLGAVAMFDPKNGAEQGALTAANTQSTLGKFAIKPADPSRYGALTDALPPPAAHFTL